MPKWERLLRELRKLSDLRVKRGLLKLKRTTMMISRS
jgi:hypothetical protein